MFVVAKKYLHFFLSIGNGGVGKSSLINRFVYNTYDDSYKKTIGVDFCEKEQYVAKLNQTVKFMLWDTGMIFVYLIMYK